MTLSDLEKITQPIFYVTPDVTRAIGLEDLLPNYHIVCLDDTPVVDLLLKRGVKVFSLERELGRKNTIFRSTSQLLRHPKVLSYIKNQAGDKTPNILFFKPSLALDRICKTEGYNKLGNRADLNRIFEDKILFAQFLRRAGLPLPPGETGELSQLSFGSLSQRYGSCLVVQFGRGWAGRTTFLVDKSEKLLELKRRYPARKVRVAQFIRGLTVLNNAVICGRRVLISPPATQITAPAGFTSRVLGTCGRAWPALITAKQEKEICKLTKIVGDQMRKLGYRGFFGLDFLIEKKTGQVLISENNARLTASTPFYTKLELMTGEIPLLAFHILEFLKISGLVPKTSRSIKTGTEIVLRNTFKTPVEVTGDFLPGVYSLWLKKPGYLRPGVSGEDLKTRKEILITTASMGRVVGPEIEYMKINNLDCLLNENGQLKSWVVDLTYEIRNKLRLERIKDV